MTEYKKLKCVFCSYEMASKAKNPRCGGCGSRRFEEVEEFSAVKPFRERQINQQKETMAKKQEVKEEVTHKKPVEKDDMDNDFWGDDEEDDEE